MSEVPNPLSNYVRATPTFTRTYQVVGESIQHLGTDDICDVENFLKLVCHEIAMGRVTRIRLDKVESDLSGVTENQVVSQTCCS